MIAVRSYLFLPPNFGGCFADCQQTLPHVRRWSRFIRVRQKFRAPLKKFDSLEHKNFDSILGNCNFIANVSVGLTWRSSVHPVPFDRIVDRTSVSSNPDRLVLYQAVGVINYELLKHVVNILIRNDRQCWVSSRTKFSCFIPTQHWTTGVETIVLTVHLVTLWHLDCVCEGCRCIIYRCGDNCTLTHDSLL